MSNMNLTVTLPLHTISHLSWIEYLYDPYKGLNNMTDHKMQILQKKLGILSRVSTNCQVASRTLILTG